MYHFDVRPQIERRQEEELKLFELFNELGLLFEKKYVIKKDEIYSINIPSLSTELRLLYMNWFLNAWNINAFIILKDELNKIIKIILLG